MMKKRLLYPFFLLFAFAGFVLAGDGTENNPYSVAEAIKIKNTTQTYWVKGYIVGEMRDYSNGKFFYEIAPPFEATLAYLIADNPAEMDIKKCMPVQTKDSYGDLISNPEYWRKPIITNGIIKEYFSIPGIKDLTAFRLLAEEPLTNEATYWNFFETFDTKGYVPASTEFTFAGGVYTGESGVWTFKGATWGDTGKDQKWERASARIRLTEGTTGEVGYIQMDESKPNGIGKVRFWAGNYEEDTSGGALALFVSSGDSDNWERVAHTQPITRTWTEYEFNVNRDGDLRLRIAKDETGSKGINVDKIRISDYYQAPTNVSNPTEKSVFTYHTTSEGLIVDLRDNAATVQIYSITGQNITTRKNVTGKISIPLQSGCYLLKVNSETVTVKVIVK